jgi:hypothetical protein
MTYGQVFTNRHANKAGKAALKELMAKLKS